jgi:hypothetical protein
MSGMQWTGPSYMDTTSYRNMGDAWSTPSDPHKFSPAQVDRSTFHKGATGEGLAYLDPVSGQYRPSISQQEAHLAAYDIGTAKGVDVFQVSRVTTKACNILCCCPNLTCLYLLFGHRDLILRSTIRHNISMQTAM